LGGEEGGGALPREGGPAGTGTPSPRLISSTANAVPGQSRPGRRAGDSIAGLMETTA